MSEQEYYRVCGCVYVSNADLAQAVAVVMTALSTAKQGGFTVSAVTEHEDGSRTERRL